MDLLVNGHDHIVCDPSSLDVLHGKEAEASAIWMSCRSSAVQGKKGMASTFWMICRAVFCSARRAWHSHS